MPHALRAASRWCCTATVAACLALTASMATAAPGDASDTDGSLETESASVDAFGHDHGHTHGHATSRSRTGSRGLELDPIAAARITIGPPLPAIPDDAPRTRAEISDYRETMRHAEVVDFLETLAARSDRVHLDSIGTSHEGRDLPVAIVADPPVRTVREARRGGREVVLLFGDIHAGEVCGKEALCMLARDIALAESPAILDELVIAFVPILNADGNERMAPDNRPGQDGPDEMGIRPNAQGLDLNRDWIKLDAPETRAIVRFQNTWDPLVIVDTHTTNGSRHRYVITYQGPKHPAGDADVITTVRDDLLPAIGERLKETSGYHSYFYGNFARRHTMWTTYPGEPRYGAAYRGMRNRIGILSEAYAYASYRDRVVGTYYFCDAILQETAARHRELRNLVDAADRRVRTADVGTPVALRIEARPLPEPADILGYVEYDDDGNRIDPAGPKTYTIPVINDFVPTLSVPRPVGYVIPASMADIALHLERHGIDVDRLREDLELEIGSYRIQRADESERAMQGRNRLRIDVGPAITHRKLVPAGSYIVRCDQSLGTLASYMLEPASGDGLAAWNFIPIAAGDTWPIRRLVDDVPLTTEPADLLEGAERRTAGQDPDADEPVRLTYDRLYGAASRGRGPDLSPSASTPRGWLDDRHYLHTRGGRTLQVEALTGHGTPLEVDFAAIADRLAAVPGIDSDDASRLARRHFRAGRDDGVLFSHAGDLWFAAADGTGARRLTSHPGDEVLPALAPTGDWAMYVRDDELWSVDVATATERQLTRGSGDGIRNGRASWVYFEELFGRNWRAAWWSPDGQRIAFLRTDESTVPHHTLIDDRRWMQRVERERYPKPGDRNPHVTVHVVDRAGGAITQVDLSEYVEGDHLVTHVSWTDDARSVRLHVQDRTQTWLDVLRADPASGRVTKLFRDQTEAWIDSPGASRELADGRFLYSSERDGWRHLYLYESDGRLVRQVTSGDFAFRRIEHLDTERGVLLFTATVAGPVATHLYRVPLDGSEPARRLTRERGSHSVQVSPDGRLFVDAWSSIDQPTRVALRDTETGDRIRWIDDNPARGLADIALGEIRHERIELPDGVVLDGLLHLPPDFDPTRRYPAWFVTYAGPAAPTVRDSWSGGRRWERMLAEEDVIVFRADPYPASGQGAKSAWTAYQQLGVRETEDIRHLIAWLVEHPWIDPERIGMAGHSYGGFITAYAMTQTELFVCGIAGAPVTDWRLYDTIYTERYMRTPQDNPEGYRETSVVDSARDLHGTLLLAWGDLDDNVHPSNAIQLLDALQRADKDVVPMIYPGRRHGFRGRHWTRTQFDFIQEHLDPGRDAPDPGTMPPGATADAAVDAGAGGGAGIGAGTGAGAGTGVGTGTGTGTGGDETEASGTGTTRRR